MLASFISPTKKMRDYVKQQGDAILVHVNASIRTCRVRDPKGMYRLVDNGIFKGSPFTGLHPDAPYEVPETGESDLRLNTEIEDVEESAERVIALLKDRKYL